MGYTFRNAITPSEMTDRLDLHNTHDLFGIQATCAQDGDGWYKGLEWLTKEVVGIKCNYKCFLAFLAIERAKKEVLQTYVKIC